MKKYPTINYIGNKRSIAEWIIDCIPKDVSSVLDLFCGGCSVSYALKQNGFSVIANDALYSNYILAKALIENSGSKLDINEILSASKFDISDNIKEALKFLENNIYYDYEVNELCKLVEKSQTLKKYDKFIFLSLLRRAMIRKIPYSRMNIKWEEIKKLRDEQYSYAKYGRYRHYHNVPFTEHMLKSLDEYNNAVFDNGKICLACHDDALDCINKLTQPVDLIYMDPPYPSTMNKYDEFYGGIDKMLGFSPKFKSILTNRDSFLDVFYSLINAARGKTKYILISLNNKCYPSSEVLLGSIKPLVNNTRIFYKNHVYRITGKQNKNTNQEILILCELK